MENSLALRLKFEKANAIASPYVLRILKNLLGPVDVVLLGLNSASNKFPPIAVFLIIPERIKPTVPNTSLITASPRPGPKNAIKSRGVPNANASIKDTCSINAVANVKTLASASLQSMTKVTGRARALLKNTPIAAGLNAVKIAPKIRFRRVSENKTAAPIITEKADNASLLTAKRLAKIYLGITEKALATAVTPISNQLVYLSSSE